MTQENLYKYLCCAKEGVGGYWLTWCGKRVPYTRDYLGIAATCYHITCPECLKEWEERLAFRTEERLRDDV